MVAMATGRSIYLPPLGGARFSKNRILWSQFYFRIEWGSEVGGRLGHEPFTNAETVDESTEPKYNRRRLPRGGAV